MVKIFLGEKIKTFSERLRFFGKGSNYFWSGLDVFGNGLDFFVWLRFLRDGLRIEFFQGIESFFMGIEIYFSGSWTWDIFKVINFFQVGELMFPQVGFKFFMNKDFLTWELLEVSSRELNSSGGGWGLFMVIEFSFRVVESILRCEVFSHRLWICFGG